LIRGGSGSREENASKQNIAFSSEVEPGSREENAPKQNVAFSSEVEPGSREENASKQKELSPFGSDVIRTERAPGDAL
jgi:hypothetical protein